MNWSKIVAVSALLCSPLGGGSVAGAQPFPPIISRADLEAAEYGFRLAGELVSPFGGAAGSDVAIVRDLNEDGLDDLVVSGVTVDTGAGEDAGRVYVRFGSAAPWPGVVLLADVDGGNGFVIDGEEAEDVLGLVVDSAGDFNDDGAGDLLIAAPGDQTEDSPGKAYVVFGDESLGASGSFDLATLDGTNGFRIDGEVADDLLGTSAALAGDLNGDGLRDLAIGAPSFFFADVSVPGRVYVLFGGTAAPGGTFDLSTLDGSNGFVVDGADLGDELGDSLSPVGDVNGDGFDDLMMGALRHGDDGRSYVLFGGANVGASGSIAVADFDGTNGFAFDPPEAAGFHPRSLAATGDFDDDGIQDLLIGQNLFGLFEAYLVFGATDLGAGGLVDLETLGTGTGVIFRGTTNTGLSVAGGRDLNRDGISDLAIGNGFTSVGTDPFAAGEGYLVAGGSHWRTRGEFDLATLDGVNGFRVVGSTESDELSSRIALGGDVNGDALPDSIWSLREARDGGVGGAVVVFGRQTPEPITLEIEPLVAGSPAEISITDGPPNGTVGVAISVTGFGTQELEGLGITLTLDSPLLATTVPTDAQGSGTASITPPSAASGQTVWFQAVTNGNVSSVAVELVR